MMVLNVEIIIVIITDMTYTESGVTQIALNVFHMDSLLDHDTFRVTLCIFSFR